MSTTSQNLTSVEITIAGRTLTINCPAEEIGGLKQAADKVDQMIRHTLANSATASTEQAALLTAINFGHQLMIQQRSDSGAIQDVEAIIHRLHQTLKVKLTAEGEPSNS